MAEWSDADWNAYEDDAGFNYLETYGGTSDFGSDATSFLGDIVNVGVGFYQSKNALEQAKLQAERDRISYNQQVPKYTTNNNNTLMYVGIGAVVLVGLVLVFRK